MAKVHNSQVDIRKPYTTIAGDDTFSGRTYDERYITEFIIGYELPCNNTTAFLTPALRNRNGVLTPEVNLVGRPKEVYDAALQLLTDVVEGNVIAEDLLVELIRQLILFRDEKRGQLEKLLKSLKTDNTGLSAETISGA